MTFVISARTTGHLGWVCAVLVSVGQHHPLVWDKHVWGLLGDEGTHAAVGNGLIQVDQLFGYLEKCILNAWNQRANSYICGGPGSSMRDSINVVEKIFKLYPGVELQLVTNLVNSFYHESFNAKNKFV